MSNREHDIIVVKVPLKKRPIDIPANFPPLNGLHLELLENKKKLKAGLPLIPLVQKPIAPKTIQSQPQPVYAKPPERKEINGNVIRSPTHSRPTSQPTSKASSRAPTPKPESFDIKAESNKSSSNTPPRDDRDMVEALRSESNREIPQQSIPPPQEQPPVDDTPQEPEKTPEQLEEDERQELKWKFKIMKKTYPKLEIPEFHDHSDINTMRRTYEDFKKGIHLDESVGTYRKFLIGAFMAIEFCGTKFAGFDLTGLTKQQMKEMSKYEGLLIELGEKSYSTFGANLPVELKLLGLIVLQTALFYVGKIIAQKAGDNVFEFFNIFMKASDPDTKDTSAEDGKTMSGPSISLSDIRRMAVDDD